MVYMYMFFSFYQDMFALTNNCTRDVVLHVCLSALELGYHGIFIKLKVQIKMKDFNALNNLTVQKGRQK